MFHCGCANREKFVIMFYILLPIREFSGINESLFYIDIFLFSLLGYIRHK